MDTSIRHDELTVEIDLDDHYLASRTVELSGLSYRMLDYHVRATAVLHPAWPGRRGRPRVFTGADVVRARLVAHLAELGARSPTIRRVFEQLPEPVDEWPSYLFIGPDGTVTSMHPPWDAWWGISTYWLRHVRREPVSRAA